MNNVIRMINAHGIHASIKESRNNVDLSQPAQG